MCDENLIFEKMEVICNIIIVKLSIQNAFSLAILTQKKVYGEDYQFNCQWD